MYLHLNLNTLRLNDWGSHEQTVKEANYPPLLCQSMQKSEFLQKVKFKSLCIKVT